MESKLNVEIGAELKDLNASFAAASKSVSNFVVNADGQIVGFTKSIVTLERQLKTFQAGVRSSMDASRIATLNSAIEITKNRISETNKVITGVGFTGFKKGANEAGFALTNLGRIAQDAPFGFIGIQNNLNPLLESFARLKAETGSTGTALKALGSSLIGPAGLGIALSVVSAAVLFYQQYQQRANKTVNEAKKSADEYINSLGQVEQAQLKGAQNAAGELTILKLLYDQTQNVALSQKLRLDAVNQLQEKYPAYFKNLSDESFLAGTAKDAYDRLTTSVLATARARAAGDLITKNSSRQLENEQKITDLENEQIKNRSKLDTTNAELKLASDNLFYVLKARDAQKEFDETQRSINNLKTDSNILTGRNLELVKSINTETEKGAVLTGNVGNEIQGNTDKTEKLKKVTQEWLDLMWAKGRDKAVSGLSTETSIPGGDLHGDITKKAQTASLAQLKKGSKEYLNHVDDFNKNIIAATNNGLVSGLSGIGEAIGAALASGENVLEAFGNSILSTIGDVLVQFGKLTIAAGVASLALKSALKLGNPIAAIAAGVALVAIGSLVKGASSGGYGGQGAGGVASRKIPGFANGVRDFAGGMAIVGERGPELVNLPTGSSVIPNHNIAAMGGGGGIVLQASIGMRLDDLFVRLEEVGKRRRRLGIA